MAMSRPEKSTLIVFITTRPKEGSTNTSGLHEWATNTLNRLESSVPAHIPDSSALLYETDEEGVLVYSTKGSEELSLLEAKIKSLEFLVPTTWRLYQQLTLPSEPTQTLLEVYLASPRIIVLNGMTPSPQREANFNNWYSEEHIPMLSQAPGWIYSMRYRLVASNEEASQYLAMHAWESELSLASTPYKVAVSTPWRMSVVGTVIARERRVAKFVQRL